MTEEHGTDEAAESETARTAPITVAAQPGFTTVTSYDGNFDDLSKLGMKVAFLTLFTLGIYRFWGKTNIRQYLWSHIAVLGNRLEYTGTARELLLGFLIVLAILVPLIAVISILNFFIGVDTPARIVFEISQTVIIITLIGFASYRARRYRLSRTLLRGIRFVQAGSAGRYAFLWVKYLVLMSITLGIARPWGDVALHRYVMTHCWFGNQNFNYDGGAKPLVWKWILCLILAPFTFGLSLIWYAAAKTRYLIGQTSFAGRKFKLPITFGDIFVLYLPYVLVMGLVIFIFWNLIQDSLLSQHYGGTNIETLSIEIAIKAAIGFVVLMIVSSVASLLLITSRLLKLIAEKFEIEGNVEFDQIVQNAAAGPDRGEGLADALDIGGGLDVGL